MTGKYGPYQSQYREYLDERCSRCGAARRDHAEVMTGAHEDEPEKLICPGSTFSTEAPIYRLATSSPVPQVGITFDVTLPKPCVEEALKILDRLSFDEGSAERRLLKEAQSVLHTLRRAL